VCSSWSLLTWALDEPVRLSHRAPTEPVSLSLTHRHWVSAVAFSPDGARTLTGTNDPIIRTGQLRLWDSAAGVPIGDGLLQPGPILALAFSPDGRHFLSGIGNPSYGPREAQLWDSATHQPLG
jgi:WD40 repeat protein